MYSKLPSCEISLYALVWVTGVFYSVYKVYLTGTLFSHSSDSDDFTTGWSFLNRKRDISDYEWKTWVNLLWMIAPWVCVHIFFAELIRRRNHAILPYWYCIISTIVLLKFFEPLAVLLLLVQPCIFYLLLQFQRPTLVWLASLVFLVGINFDQTLGWLSLPDAQHYLLFMGVVWGHLRCLSFCFDCLSENRSDTHLNDLVSLLSYYFYLPTIFLGPLILYKTFVTGMAQPYKTWTLQRCLGTLCNLFRFIGWLFITEFILHYIYCNALQCQSEVVSQLSTWALCGLGYCMGQFFMNKYTVVYGLPGTIARAEQIEAPAHPKCIARIHLYSDMWKYFDRGLYNFLVKYIYVPCLGLAPTLGRKLLGSFVCFGFVYLWHRTYLFILVWSVLNFLGITIEAIFKLIGSSAFFSHWEEQHLSPNNIRRLHALIASPLFAMSCISNFYFFGGMEIGNIFTKRFTTDVTLEMYLIVLTFCYCCCQVSIEVKNWEERKKTSKTGECLLSDLKKME